MTVLSRLRLVLALVIAVFAAAAAYTSLTIVERQNFLREVSRYNVVWASSQALSELLLFEHRLAAFALPDSGITKDDVQLRFDILFNRANILRGGDVADMLASDSEQEAVVGEFEQVLAELEPLVAGIDQPGMVAEVLARLAPLERKFNRFAAKANHFGGARVAEDQRVLLDLHWLFSGLAAGLVLCGLALIVLLLVQNRIIARGRDELRLLSDNLRVAKETAESASDAKSRFLANMSHELRTPLNAIVGFGGMIAEETLGAVSPPKYREYARDIVRSGTHMTDLVNDILMMAKLEAGHLDIEVRPLNLRDQVDGALAIFRGTSMARGADVAIEAGGDWPHLRADERALRQMLLNLLSNAVKFSLAGSPVRIACRKAEGGDLHLSVSDCGIGMTREQAELAVQPFRQVDETLGRKYNGTGLGLSIVKGLIERHGGQMVIDSEPGTGSRISLVFPGALVVPLSVVRVA